MKDRKNKMSTQQRIIYIYIWSFSNFKDHKLLCMIVLWYVSSYSTFWNKNCKDRTVILLWNYIVAELTLSFLSWKSTIIARKSHVLSASTRSLNTWAPFSEKKNWFIIIKTKKKSDHNKPNLKMYFGGHCTIYTCQYDEGKFDLKI